MHRIPAAFLIACVAVLHGISAFAAVPSAALSTTPGCLAYCPQGDIVMTVIVRDLSNFLVSNALVRIDFSGCPGIKACAPDSTESYTIGPAHPALAHAEAHVFRNSPIFSPSWWKTAEGIFGPSFTTKGVGKGSGIGLDLVRRILRRHDEAIEVDSSPRRTQFRVTVPAER